MHVTIRVQKGIPSLRSQVLARLVMRALLVQRESLRATEAKHFHVVHYTIQNDHLHLIVESPDKRGIARGVAGLEVRIARAVNKLLKRRGRFWKERYHRRDLRTPTETRNVLRYVLLNTQKHHRIIGDCCFADPKSSAATFDGFAREPFVVDDPLRWEHVVPRTWLLRVGWRRRGLIDPVDVPPSSPHRY